MIPLKGEEMRKQIVINLLCILTLALIAGAPVFSQTTDVDGYVLDPNWYSWVVPYAQTEFGVLTAPAGPSEAGSPWYEYGVAGNRGGDESTPGYSGNTENYVDNYRCGEFGYFRKPGMGSGTWTLATWSRWWRPSFLIQKDYPWTLPGKAILRLHANMFSYGASWPGNTFTPSNGPWNELGQTFVATGSAITMITIRMPLAGIDFTATVHDGGPGGSQVGPTKNFTSRSGPTDQRLFYNGNDLPTIPGHTYYLRLKAAGTTQGLFCESEPIPDMSDPMPNGCVYHDGVPDQSRDLGLIICSDDDGIVTDLNIDKGATYGTPVPQNVTRFGQTFTARGTSLLYFGAYITDHNTDYMATLYDGINDGVPGAKIGFSKMNSYVRYGDPEVIFTWEPNECPLTPGHTYYIEVSRVSGGTMLFCASSGNAYTQGECYVERAAVSGWDISGCIMEEESAYSAIRPAVQFTTYPAVAVADRGTRSLTVRWTTDVASDTTVEYGAWNANYTNTYYSSALTTDHVAILTGLEPNTMYHFRVTARTSGYKANVTRDLVNATINETPNLLVNPSFEEVPPGPPNHSRAIAAPWYFSGFGWQAADGNYFASVPPYTGGWFADPAINGAAAHGYAYQTVPATPGTTYNFTAAIYTHILETEKKDVIVGSSPPVKVPYIRFKGWNVDTEIDYVRLGIDPTGGTDKTSANIIWTPAMYSHDSWTVAGVKATASADHITVFVKMDNNSSAFHIYGIDDCRLSADYPPAVPISSVKSDTPDGPVTVGDLIITATPTEAGAYYAETADRYQGIRIQSEQSVAIGSKVTVAGMLTTNPDTHERFIANAVFINSTPDSAPKPLVMQAKSIGGASFGSLIPEVPGSVGLHNTGLVVRIAGRVTAKDSNGSSYIWVSDGSLPGDGIKVDTSHLASTDVPEEGAFVSISGISSLYLDGVVKPILIARRASDIN